MQTLADNKKLKSYPHLKAPAPAITSAYARYLAANGNPLGIQAIALPDEVKGYLHSHYASPPQCLSHIPETRDRHRVRLCPMCGAPKCSTLDHLLPKEDYAEFAIFSRNLVPACDCNTRRKQTLIGHQPGERILHPYFDTCLSERLITAEFTDLCVVPKTEVVPIVGPAHPQYAAICFHIDKIVRPSGITTFFIERWADFLRRPSLVVRKLDSDPTDLPALLDTLTDEREKLDELHRGKNNWHSAFVSGLLAPAVALWLTVPTLFRC